MNVEDFRAYCLAKKGVTEGFPFGGDTLVFKVMDKLFALTNVDQFQSINLKCNPGRAIELREQYPHGVLPGYHMNKAHWNTVMTQAGIPETLLYELIDHSYQLIVDGLSRKLRAELEAMV